MIFSKNLINTNGGPFIEQHPVFGGGANILSGSLVVRGPTAATNGAFIVNPANTSTNLVGVIGVMAEQDTNATSGNDSNKTGTNYTLKKVIVNPDAVFEIEYSQASADILAVTSTSGTTVTISSIESSLDSGWLYAVSGTGAGRLTFITTSTSGSVTTKEATGWDSTTKVIKILPRFYKNIFFNSTFDKLATQAATGVTGAIVWAPRIEADSVGSTELDPTKHSGLTGLNSGIGAKFSTRIVFTTYAAYNG